MGDKRDHPHLERGPVTGPLMALFCLVIGGMVGAISYGFFQWEPESPSESLLQKVALEGFLTLTLFTVLAFIWSLFTPRWLERLMQSAYTKLLLSVGLLLFVALCLSIYFNVRK